MQIRRHPAPFDASPEPAPESGRRETPSSVRELERNIMILMRAGFSDNLA